jgi:toxin HigB-1
VAETCADTSELGLRVLCVLCVSEIISALNRRRREQAVDRERILLIEAIPPGNRLERMRGNRNGQHSIRINDQYRICFRWEAGYADEVEITDYH